MSTPTSTPLHTYARQRVASNAAAAARRLRDDAPLLAAAGAGAVVAVATHGRAWGTPPATQLPRLRTRATERDELGTVAVEWEGDGRLTGWPALRGRLLVTATSSSRTDLVLVAPPPLRRALATPGVDALHQRRITAVASQRYLAEIRDQLGRDRPPLTTPARCSWRADGDQPWFLHHLEAVAVAPGELADRLRADADGLARRATEVAVQRAGEALHAGRFRAPADPDVTVTHTDRNDIELLTLHWWSDEEATGWPQLSLRFVVEAAAHGAHLVLLSTRPPRYDLSRNRLDRSARDRIIAQAAADVATAMATELHLEPRRSLEVAAVTAGVGSA